MYSVNSPLIHQKPGLGNPGDPLLMPSGPVGFSEPLLEKQTIRESESRRNVSFKGEWSSSSCGGSPSVPETNFLSEIPEIMIGFLANRLLFTSAPLNAVLRKVREVTQVVGSGGSVKSLTDLVGFLFSSLNHYALRLVVFECSMSAEVFFLTGFLFRHGDDGKELEACK